MLPRFEEVNLHTFLRCDCLKVAKLSCLETPHGHGHLLHTRVRRQGCLDALCSNVAAKLTTQAEQSSEEAAQQQRSKHCRHRRHPRRRRGRPRPRTVITARAKRLVSLGSAGYKNERIVG